MAPMLFARAIMAGEPLKVFNGGDMERDFTYVDDIVRERGASYRQNPRWRRADDDI